MSGRTLVDEHQRYGITSHGSGINAYAGNKHITNHPHHQQQQHQHQTLLPLRHYHNQPKAGESHSHVQQQQLQHHLHHYAAAHHQPPHAWWHAVTALGATPSTIAPAAATANATAAAGGVCGEEVNATQAVYASNSTKRGEHFF
ncbi:unnamed protein product [Ceratitis capitata]|uniref:(Mediterranean fruit fly) hypothetical protein n=2 Tax=Ceratitis capitata TaxID=7213 RepID=A0A811VJJ2_CERCA|nr:unnamed protein product [Ceratitis capitata]